MKVSAILKEKGSSRVATISPDLSVADAVGELSRLGFGALVVSNDGAHADGILSERDIVRRIGSDGGEALDAPVSDLMTRSVESCIAEDTALDILGRMTQGRFRHMPVLGADGRMIGLLSIGDVVKARLEEIERDNAEMLEMFHS